MYFDFDLVRLMLGLGGLVCGGEEEGLFFCFFLFLFGLIGFFEMDLEVIMVLCLFLLFVMVIFCLNCLVMFFVLIGVLFVEVLVLFL